MNDPETIELLRRSREEILQLRRINSELAPKAEAYHQISAVLNLLPRPPQGFEEDFAWRLQKKIEEIEAGLTKPEPAKVEG